MKNKLLRLTELIQEGFPENIVELFKSDETPPLEVRLALIGEARTFHQNRADNLWLQAGKKRTPAERRATAQAELAAFVSAYLTGDVKEFAETGVEAMRALGRQGEEDIVKSLARRSR